jgi:hypothetical protein
MCALQTSAMVVTFLVAGPAFAQCLPDPTVGNGTTTCAGADTDGLTVANANTRIIVASGAIVQPGSRAAGQPGSDHQPCKQCLLPDQWLG